MTVGGGGWKVEGGVVMAVGSGVSIFTTQIINIDI